MLFSTPVFEDHKTHIRLDGKPLSTLRAQKRCLTKGKIVNPSKLLRTPAPSRSSPVCFASSSSSNGNIAVASVPEQTAPLKIVITGAGIGGLVLAVGLLKQGYEVVILERDLTAIRGEGKYRGPIQIQSNALAALEALDATVAEKVLAEGCITGDRINGLCDGITGEW